MSAPPTLFHVADPMCSWCWGFRPQWEAIRASLPAGLAVRLVMGGLAPDSDEPMPPETRAYVQEQWRLVEQRTGARFEWAFWDRCAPRRSTYPACRAVLAAAEQGPGLDFAMFAAIQRAYYREARNPSDREVLLSLAGEVEGLDPERYRRELGSPENEEALRRDLALRARLGVRAFPSLVLELPGRRATVGSGFELAGVVSARIAEVLAEG